MAHAIMNTDNIQFKNAASEDNLKLAVDSNAKMTFSSDVHDTGKIVIKGIRDDAAGDSVPTKGYVDSARLGFNLQQPVAYATTAQLDETDVTISLSDQTIVATNASLKGMFDTTDDILVDTRLLVKDGASAVGDKANGIYQVTARSSDTAWTLTRAAPLDEAHEVVPGLAVHVDSGNTNANSVFVLTSNLYTSLVESGKAVNGAHIAGDTTIATDAFSSAPTQYMGVKIGNFYYTIQSATTTEITIAAPGLLENVADDTLIYKGPVMKAQDASDSNGDMNANDFTWFLFNTAGDIAVQTGSGLYKDSTSGEIKIRSVTDDGSNLRVTSSNKLEFRDNKILIHSDADGHLHAEADTQISLNINGTDEMTLTASEATFGTHIVIPNDGQIGSAGSKNAMSIASDGVVSVNDDTDASSTTTGALKVTGGVGIAKSLHVGLDAVIGDDLSLKSDAAVLNFGADSDVKLTHVADTGLLLNSDMELQFRDNAVLIKSDADGHLHAEADQQISLNINGTDEMTLTASEATFGTNIVIPDDGKIGSSSDKDAISISSAGVVNISSTTASTSKSTGALTVAGGVGISGKTHFGNHVHFPHDSAVVYFGAGDDVTMTHVKDVGLDFNLRLKATHFHASSDANLKKNIQTIQDVDKILDNVNGVQYNWKKGDATQEYGVLAQDVQKVMPDSVSEDCNKHLAVNYNHLVGVLIAAVKDQRARIAELENRLN